MTIRVSNEWSIILCSLELHGVIVIDWSPPVGSPRWLDMKTLHILCWRPSDWFRWGYAKDWYDGPWQEFRLGPFGAYFWRW